MRESRCFTAGWGTGGTGDPPGGGISRKTFIGQIGLLLAGCLAGCTPVKILLKAYPAKFREDRELADEYLRAFVATVIPGAPIDDPDLVRIYTDGDYPFRPHCAFFVSDLAKRSADLFGEEKFPRLDAVRRTRVIRDGLDSDPIVSRLYRGAVFMAQVSFFGSIYDDARGCPLIGYPGTETYHSPEEMFYPRAAEWLSAEATADGNFP